MRKEAEIIMRIIVRTEEETIGIITIMKKNILRMKKGIMTKTNKITIIIIESLIGTTTTIEISNTDKEIAIITMIEEQTNMKTTRIAIRRQKNTKLKSQSKLKC